MPRRAWSRDLDLDLDAVAAWGAVVTLVETDQLATLGVGPGRLGATVPGLALPAHPGREHTGPGLRGGVVGRQGQRRPRCRGTADSQRTGDERMGGAGEALRAQLRAGASVLLHCKGAYSCTGTCFDIGGTTRAALARYKRTGDPMAGSTDPASAGNGSLMRLAPVAVRHWGDRATLRDVAARQSRTTHAAPEAVDAWVAYADVLADAIAGEKRSVVLRGRADIAGWVPGKAAKSAALSRAPRAGPVRPLPSRAP